MAAAELSTSASLVAQELMLIRIAARPFQVVPPHQQVPSSWIAAMTRCVRASSPKATTTWLSPTSLRLPAPPALKHGSRSCRERVLQSLCSLVVAAYLTKKQTIDRHPIRLHVISHT